MTARFLITGFVSALVIQTGFLSPVLAKTPTPTVEVGVEVRFFTISWPALVQLTDKERGDSICRKALVGSSNPGGFLLKSDIDAFQFFETLQGHSPTKIVHAPKFVVPDGKRIEVTNTQYFVSNVDIVESHGHCFFIPKNEPFKTGMKLSVQATVSKKRDVVRLHLKVKDKSLNAPVPLFPVTTMITPIFEGGAQGQPVPFTQFLQQPSFTTHILDKRLTIPDGSTVLLDGWTMTDYRTEETGIPIAEDLPFIGGFFKKTVPVREASHIYLMVTPHVIVSDESHRVPAKATSHRTKVKAHKQAALPQR